MINRRKFVSRSALSLAGLMIAETGLGSAVTHSPSTASGNTTAPPYDLMKDVLKYRKIDSHVHSDLYDGK
ncbi:hypothetical protein [Daejeonella sp.]|uniref:hypothetical protein n=1 Tax=Daejeonella sp. TaxID=2805397 RepID=UPI0030BCCEE9